MHYKVTLMKPVRCLHLAGTLERGDRGNTVVVMSMLKPLQDLRWPDATPGEILKAMSEINKSNHIKSNKISCQIISGLGRLTNTRIGNEQGPPLTCRISISMQYYSGQKNLAYMYHHHTEAIPRPLACMDAISQLGKTIQERHSKAVRLAGGAPDNGNGRLVKSKKVTYAFITVIRMEGNIPLLDQGFFGVWIGPLTGPLSIVEACCCATVRADRRKGDPVFTSEVTEITVKRAVIAEASCEALERDGPGRPGRKANAKAKS
eukprot:XP_011667654.1 PREDICTED: uncharacterized protein LOC105439853 [Strongylocentrotus purpuratus]